MKILDSDNNINFDKLTSKRKIKTLIWDKDIYSTNSSSGFALKNDNSDYPLQIGIFFYDLYLNMIVLKKDVNENYYNNTAG